MPEYLAPGVFIEETSFRPKTIEGVSTSTTGFIGPTRFGPIAGEPPLLTSFGEFERIYGGIDRLDFGDGLTHNYLAHAVRAFFDEGGRRLYVARVFQGDETAARATWTPDVSPDPVFELRARHAGAAGGFTVTFRLLLSQNILDTEPVDPANITMTSPAASTYSVLRGAAANDVVLATRTASPDTLEAYWVERYFDTTLGRHNLRLRQDDADASPPVVTSLDEVNDVRLLTANVIIGAMGEFMDESSWDGLAIDPAHRNGLIRTFAEEPTRRATELYVPLVITVPDGTNGAELANSLLDQPNLAGDGETIREALGNEFAGVDISEAARSFRATLSNGSDGTAPQPEDYEGDDNDGEKSGLLAFEDLEDISIVAAPGATLDFNDNLLVASSIMRLLIMHCERMRYRVAVLDSGNGMTPGEVREMAASIDTTRAAIYYPWVRILDPVTDQEVVMPPSGYLAGIWARTDVEYGVHRSPANQVVRSALGFEYLINKAQQEVLNPDGINVLRFFEGRGYRVWGARTRSSDPEWKYLNVRRYFAFLERSIEKGTQWVVFQNNGDLLWAKVRRTIEDFLFNEWKENHLFGTTPKEAFFVKCDRTTMTQNDIDNGRLICLIGVAPLRPAEFVIFRIGQKTADAT
jgi:phage tail sheath protein FI